MAKDKEAVIPEAHDSFHTKYRPQTLDRMIGQEKIVTRLKGVIKTQKYPKAMLFVGASSAGKTTTARAFVADLFGVKTLKGNVDYTEINGADARGIDDMRGMLKVAHLKPRYAPRRVILIDEAQQITGVAEQALLKPLENPPPSTLFILCSMEPEKLHQAIKNRCTQYALEPYSQDDMRKYIKRIVKNEEMTYVDDEVIAKLVENSNGEFRTAANLTEALDQYVGGLDKVPKTLKPEVVEAALSSTESADQAIAIAALVGVYANKYRAVHRALLDTTDGFRMLNTLLFMNGFLLNHIALRGEKHRSVWYNKQNIELLDNVKKLSKVKEGQELRAYATVQSALVDMKLKAGSFAVAETTLICATLFDGLERIRPLMILKDKD